MDREKLKAVYILNTPVTGTTYNALEMISSI